MSTADTYVRARIDTVTKKRAADALDAMGLSISDANRLLLIRVAPRSVTCPSRSRSPMPGP
ncbi:MAG: type II toxin-antitoxin system RelB/DinJ family antitoxin, partial [Burkholderiales bacterium]|nr:type II toxin-antitoxin system RelB/DinJ family antitoxin [Burkholderiales bacterium]